MKKQIEIKLFGLNELGVSEMNEFYRHNQTEYDTHVYQIGDKLGYTKKRVKHIEHFYRTGLDFTIGLYDLKRHIPGSEYGGGFFELQLKHFKHKVYEVEVVETFTEISL